MGRGKSGRGREGWVEERGGRRKEGEGRAAFGAGTHCDVEQGGKGRAKAADQMWDVLTRRCCLHTCEAHRAY